MFIQFVVSTVLTMVWRVRNAALLQIQLKTNLFGISIYFLIAWL